MGELIIKQMYDILQRFKFGLDPVRHFTAPWIWVESSLSDNH